jgi:hypothetical protein
MKKCLREVAGGREGGGAWEVVDIARRGRLYDRA